MKKGLKKALAMGVMLTSISTCAFATKVKDSDGNGYCNFGLKKGKNGYNYEYCYYYQKEYNHWAKAALNGHSSGKKTAKPGKNACADSPSVYAGTIEYRDWGIS